MGVGSPNNSESRRFANADQERAMNTNYVFLCGAMWAQYDSEDAGWELVRALHSDNPEVVFLAGAILEKTIPSA
jgi:hypothetical protein